MNFKPRDNLHTGRYCSRQMRGGIEGVAAETVRVVRDDIPASKRTARGGFCNRTCAARWSGKNRPSATGFVMNKAGYKLLWMPDHPQSHSQKGYIFEQRWVVQQKIGRPLTRAEVVHHKNGIKNDNRPENLELMLKGDHDKLNLPRQRHRFVVSPLSGQDRNQPTCKDCGHVLEWRPGRVLDPFSGTGTTGEAAFREGMRAVLIEREPEYQGDIRRRMKLALGGPDERARESIKAKMKDKPVDHGPLFGS